MNQPRFLFLHLHDDLDAAGIQNAFAIFAVVEREQVLHTLRGCDRDTAETADGFDHFLNVACRQRIGVSADERPQLVGDQRRELPARAGNEVVRNVRCPEDTGQKQIIRHTRRVNDDIFVVEVDLVAAAHGRG